MVIQQRENTVVRHRQIIHAARRLIVKYGSEHVTVRRMAKEIGVTEGAIYRHFKCKRDILVFLIDEAEAALMADVEGQGNDGVNVLSILERVISRVQERDGVDFVVIAEIISFGDRILDKKVYKLITRYTARIQDILTDGAAAGEIRQDLDLNKAAVLFFGMMQGVVNIWTLSHRGFDLGDKYTQVWQIFRESIIRR